LGAPRARIPRSLGVPVDTPGQRLSPRGTDADTIGAPANFVYDAACVRGSGADRGISHATLTYRRLAIELCAGRIYVFVTAAPGARTLRGVTVGQKLATAKLQYPSLRCASATGDSTDPPVTLYWYCSGEVGSTGHYLYFGGDPIASIAMGRVPLH
jgi:hypothetical protein